MSSARKPVPRPTIRNTAPPLRRIRRGMTSSCGGRPWATKRNEPSQSAPEKPAHRTSHTRLRRPRGEIIEQHLAAGIGERNVANKRRNTPTLNEMPRVERLQPPTEQHPIAPE